MRQGRLIVHSCCDPSGERHASLNIDRHIVVFVLDEQRYALPLDVTERTVRMVAVTPLPQAPEVVLGVINVQGTVLPVLDMRARFRLPRRPPGPDDQLLIARTARRTVALAVDSVIAVIETQEERTVEPQAILPALEYVAGVVMLDDGMVFIHDLDSFLSLDEAEALEAAINLA
jgi:purine-binding chemotaxis protein CheW